MPTPIKSLLPGATPDPQPIADTGSSKKLGKQDFLQLLVAQLKNQDPMNPMQGAEFSAQLAQFSSLEQLTELNKGFDGLVGAVNNQTRLSQTTMGVGLIGQNAVGEGTMMAVDANGTARATIELPASAKSVTVHLLDSMGNVIESRDFNQLSPGRQELAWQAKSAKAGNYSYAVDATGLDGKAVLPRQLVSGPVKGIAFKDGKVLLDIGGMQVPMDGLIEISPPDTPAN